jgi:hypothetical protein
MTDREQTTFSTATTPTRVGHVKHDPTEVYVGRGDGGDAHLLNTEIGDRGWLGNPFPVDQYGRADCLNRYRTEFEARLDEDPDFRATVRGLAGMKLGCWCQRLTDDGPACHAEIIAEHADRLRREAMEPTDGGTDR